MWRKTRGIVLPVLAKNMLLTALTSEVVSEQMFKEGWRLNDVV